MLKSLVNSFLSKVNSCNPFLKVKMWVIILQIMRHSTFFLLRLRFKCADPQYSPVIWSWSFTFTSYSACSIFSRIIKISAIFFSHSKRFIEFQLLPSLSFIISFKDLSMASSPRQFYTVYHIGHHPILICSHNWKQYDLDIF